MTDAATLKTKPALGGVPETLLIPLAARLLAAKQNPDLGFLDSAAEAVGAALDFDPARFAGDQASMRGSLVRAQWFDSIVERFVAAYPDALVLSIGSGLDTRANRLSLPEGVAWVDIDFPEVAALRDALVPPLPRVRSLAGDGADVAAWADLVDWRDGRAVLVIAEGVSMYLEPEQGVAWVRALAANAERKASALALALDLASPFMVRHGRRNPSVRKTEASFKWGVREPAEIERLGAGFVLKETSFDVTRRVGLAPRIGGAMYRMFTGRPIYCCAYFVRD